MLSPLDMAAHLATIAAAGTLVVATASLARGAARTTLPALGRFFLLAAAGAVALPLAFSAFSRLGSYAWLGLVAAGAALLASAWRPRAPEPAVMRASSGVLDAAALPVAGLAVLCGAAILFAAPANHDLAWLLYVGQQVLHGARPYRDLIEVNPPLVVYLSTAAAWLGQRLGIGSFAAFDGLVLALAAASAGASAWLLARVAPRRVTLWAAVAFLFLVVPFAGTEFGQREHLLVLLYTPYVVLAALRVRRLPVSRPVAVAVALAAAVGVSIKPYFVVPWLLTEVYIAARIRSASLRRPEPWLIAATGVAYVALVVLGLPAYIRLAEWGASLYAGFAPASLGAMLLTPRALLVLLALAVAFAVPGDDRLRDVRRLFAVVSFGLLLALLWQRKGWDYHWYPVLALSLFSLALTAIATLRAGARWSATVAIACVCSASALARASDPLRRGDGERYPAELRRMEALVRGYAAGGPILVLSTQVGAAFPLVNYTGLEWASRFNCLWFVDGLYPELGKDGDTVFPYHSADRMSPAERWILHAYGDDLRALKPSLILVDGREADPRLHGFQPLSFLMRDSAFAAERRHYRNLGWVGEYLVLRRADLPPPLAANPRLTRGS